MKLVVTSKLNLEFDGSDGWSELRLEPSSGNSLSRTYRALVTLLRIRQIDAIFASNPHLFQLLFIWLAKSLTLGRVRTLVFDLILRAPSTRRDFILAWIRRRLLASVDVFLCIHKDVYGYTQHFGISPQRCKYIPFKANNFDLARTIPTKDGDYLLALGASHRDYRTLVDAVRGTDIPTTILLPRRSITAHNAVLGDSLPANVNHVDYAVSREDWSRYIAESRAVVVPLLPGVLQPAGISVYLEAMIFGKPVIISRGSSTEQIVDDEKAVLVKPGSAGELRSAIELLWQDSARRQAIGARARIYALALGDHQRLIADLRSAVRFEYDNYNLR